MEASTTGVFDACANGDVQALKDLLSEYCQDNPPTSITDHEGGTLLHLSSRQGQLDVVKYLVEEMNFNCEARDKGESGATAVHDAAYGQSLPVLQYFIEERGCDPACQGEDGSTPLHPACQVTQGNLDVIRYLVEKHRVSPTCVNEEGNMPLHEAAQVGNLDAIEYLCQLEIKNISCRNRDGDSSLDLAASNGHLKVVKYFINSHKECISDLKRESESTPLHKACCNGHLCVVVYFLNELGIDSWQPDEKGQVPLHYAALSGNIDLITFLVEKKKCNVYHQSVQGHIPLHMAALSGSLDAVQYFTAVKKCNPSSAGKDGVTPLHVACQNGHTNIVKYLIHDHKVDIFHRDKEGMAAIDFAALSGNLNLVKWLAENENCFSREGDKNNSCNNEALIAASLSGQKHVVEYLIVNKYCDPHSKGSFGRTALHAACDGGNVDIVKYLIDECNANCACEDDKGDSPLHYAACHGNLELAKLLLEQPSCVCNMYHRNTSGSTALHEAAYYGHVDIVAYLVSVKHYDPQRKESNPWTPLHAASQEGHLDVVKFLVGEHGADSMCEDNEGLTPLDSALCQGHQDIAHYLRKYISCKEHAKAKNLHTSDDRLSVPPGDSMQPLAKKRAHSTGITLGNGSFGTVIEVMVGQRTYAAKTFHVEVTDAFIRKMALEVNILSCLRHPNIVQYHGLCCLSGSSVPLLLMERLATSLYCYLLEPSNARISVDLSKKVFFLCDVASGLSYLHAQNPVIVHRDLTAKNVLLDTSLTAKIADFGNARILDMDTDLTPESMTAQPGTLDYMPPEAFGENPSYSTELDMFSYGHLALLVIAQKNIRLPSLKPTSEGAMNTSRTNVHVCSELTRRKRYFEFLNTVISDSHPLLPIIEKCLSDTPNLRPSAHQVKSKLMDIAGSDYRKKRMQKRLGDCITLEELQLIRTLQEKRVEIIKSLAPKWKDFGILLDFDATGNEVEIIDSDHRREGCTECCTAMFTLWLQGRGRQPATWEVLLELLADFRQTSLVDQIKSVIWY